jgi:hypothetical protein
MYAVTNTSITGLAVAHTFDSWSDVQEYVQDRNLVEYDISVLDAPHRVVTNLMSGKQVIQASDTPLCCDVSSETYWSM